MAITSRKRLDGSVSFQVKVKDPDGKWYPTPTFRLREDALEEESRLVKLKRKGMRVIGEDARTVTEEEYWEVWSDENRPSVSRGWKISQDQMHRDYISPVIGKMKMKDIDTPTIGRIMNRAKELGLGDQTRKHIYSLLRKMFNDAVEYYEMIAVSPVKPKFHRPRVGSRKRDFLTPKQSYQLLKHTKDHYLGPAIWLQMLTGMRPSEVQALRWKSVMFEQSMILICAAYNVKERRLQEFPKQDDWAYVPMPQMLKTYLKTLRKDPDEFVVHGFKQDMLSYETYYRALGPLCEEAGVPVITPHELRHSCTELYIEAGASAEDIRRLLNHASLSATKNYIHRTDERLNRIAGSLKKSFPNNFPIEKKRAFKNTKEKRSDVH